MPLSLFVTLSPSFKYEPEEGRTLGMGVAMLLRAWQGTGAADVLAGWRGGGVEGRIQCVLSTHCGPGPGLAALACVQGVTSVAGKTNRRRK